MATNARVDDLIARWILFRTATPEPGRYVKLSVDLYNVRNGKDDGGVPYPAGLIDADDAIMASVEHYFLCRGWVGNGMYPLDEVIQLVDMYDAAKFLHIAPRHNPSKPVTPLSLMQVTYQHKGIDDGIDDAKRFKVSTPILWRKPPMYY